MDYIVYGQFAPVNGNAGATDGSTKRGKDKSNACKGGIFHKYSNLSVYLITALKESFLATALLLIQCVYPTHSLTLDHSSIAFLLHGFKKV